MTIWIDAQLSPDIAGWIQSSFEGVHAAAVRDIGLRHAEDPEIFEAARTADAVVLTKDSDFTELVNRLGPPPHVIWVRVGNTSRAEMKRILAVHLADVMLLIRHGEPLVEISHS